MSGRCSALLGSALTLYSTWPSAQMLAVESLPLRPSPRLARAVDAYTHSGTPISLQLTLDLAERSDDASRGSLPLQLAYTLRAYPWVSAPERVLQERIDLEAAKPAFLAVNVNGQEHGVSRVLRLPGGRWLVRREDLEQWRLRVPSHPPVVFRDEEYYALESYEGTTVRVNEPLQALDLTVEPRHFAPTQVQATRTRAALPAQSPAGGFVNYDVFLNATTEVRRVDALFEAAVFNRYGVGISDFLAPGGHTSRDFIRLDTAWRRDYPADMKSLIIGDAIGSSGLWGRPVRFGGLSYGTNFSTRPGFVTFPLPILTGEAALPTTAELYVDGVLRQSSQVPPGPFSIQNVPVVTGRGEVRLVVRDLLGREQVIAAPYYASNQLLREGLVEESYELGAVRSNFGVRSHDYGRAMATAQRRKGLTDRVTGEARIELLRDQQTIGAGASVAFPAIGVFTGATALSRGERGEGGLVSAAFERQVWQGVSFGVRSQWASPRFVQLGLQPDRLAPMRVIVGNVGYAPAGWGSFGAGYVRQDERERPGVEIVSASYSVNVARSVALILFGFKPVHGGGSSAVGVTLAMGLQDRRSASINYTAQSGNDQASVEFQQNLPVGTGVGYRLLAGGGARGGRQEAGIAYQNDRGTYTLEAGRAEGETALRASAAGAYAVLGGNAFLARRLDESFAVARVEGFPDVGLYVNNQLVARTDRAGYAILPRLLAYQSNPVRIDTTALPLDTHIAATALDAVPYYRSGLFLDFAVTRANGAVLVLIRPDGTPLPVGARVNIIGSDQTFPVAQRGEVYVTGLSATNRLRASWANEHCEFEVSPGASLGTQPRLGPIVCADTKHQ